MTNRFATALAALILILAAPAVVSAHAQLLDSTPAADSTVLTVPPEIVLKYDDPLIPTSSSFEVVNASGTSVLSGSVDTVDAHLMRAISVPLVAGAYEVRWTAATDDGHIERGTFSFTIAVATDPPGTLNPQPTATPSSSGDTGNGIVVPIVAALGILGLGAAWLVRRRKSAA